MRVINIIIFDDKIDFWNMIANGKSIVETKVRCVGIIYSKNNLRVILPDYEQRK